MAHIVLSTGGAAEAGTGMMTMVTAKRSNYIVTKEKVTSISSWLYRRKLAYRSTARVKSIQIRDSLIFVSEKLCDSTIK